MTSDRQMQRYRRRVGNACKQRKGIVKKKQFLFRPWLKSAFWQLSCCSIVHWELGLNPSKLNIHTTEDVPDYFLVRNRNKPRRTQGCTCPPIKPLQSRFYHLLWPDLRRGQFISLWPQALVGVSERRPKVPFFSGCFSELSQPNTVPCYTSQINNSYTLARTS